MWQNLNHISLLNYYNGQLFFWFVTKKRKKLMFFYFGNKIFFYYYDNVHRRLCPIITNAKILLSF